MNSSRGGIHLCCRTHVDAVSPGPLEGHIVPRSRGAGPAPSWRKGMPAGDCLPSRSGREGLLLRRARGTELSVLAGGKVARDGRDRPRKTLPESHCHSSPGVLRAQAGGPRIPRVSPLHLLHRIAPSRALSRRCRASVPPPGYCTSIQYLALRPQTPPSDRPTAGVFNACAAKARCPAAPSIELGFHRLSPPATASVFCRKEPAPSPDFRPSARPRSALRHPTLHHLAAAALSGIAALPCAAHCVTRRLPASRPFAALRRARLRCAFPALRRLHARRPSPQQASHWPGAVLRGAWPGSGQTAFVRSAG